MYIDKQSSPEFHTGNGTVGTSAQQLPDRATYHKVVIEADAGNSDTIFVGTSSNVSASNGYPLAAGEQIEIPIDTPSKVWVIGGDAGQNYKWHAT